MSHKDTYILIHDFGTDDVGGTRARYNDVLEWFDCVDSAEMLYVFQWKKKYHKDLFQNDTTVQH